MAKVELSIDGTFDCKKNCMLDTWHKPEKYPLCCQPIP